jgi:hypothetical protein
MSDTCQCGSRSQKLMREIIKKCVFTKIKNFSLLQVNGSKSLCVFYLPVHLFTNHLTVVKLLTI